MKPITLLCGFFMLLSTSSLWGQQSYFPKWYYTFDDPVNWATGIDPQNPGNTVPSFNLTPSTGWQPSIIQSSNTNHYLSFPKNSLDPTNPVQDLKFINMAPGSSGYSNFLDKEMSVEFLMQLRDFRNVAEFRFSQGRIRFNYNRIDLSIFTDQVVKTHYIYLDGKERRSIDYYLNNWRHIVITANTQTDEFKLFIDGISPIGFSGSLGGDQNNTISLGNFTRLNEHNAILNIDELAIYDKELPAGFICQHYSESSNGLAYTFVDNSDPNNPNPLCSLSEEYNDLEYENFAPGYPTTPTSDYNALRQLQSFPIPRIKEGHGLMRNFSWVSPADLSGMRVRSKCAPPGFSANNPVPSGAPYEAYLDPDKNIYRDWSYDFNVEMAKNWNYYLTMEGGYDKSTTPWTLRFNLEDYMDLLATQNAYDYRIEDENGNLVYNEAVDVLQYPMGMKTFWGSAISPYNNHTPNTSSKAAINSLSVPPVLDPALSAVCIPNPNERYLTNNWSTAYPCRNRPFFSPLHDDRPAREDGKYLANNILTALSNYLTVPRTLDLISENGEQLQALSCLEEPMFLDENVQNYILNCGTTVYPALNSVLQAAQPSFSDCENDPDCLRELDLFISEHYGYKMLNGYYQEFNNSINEASNALLTNGGKTKFSMYYQGGQNQRKEHFLWESVRTASSPMGPSNSHYSTTSIYINPKAHIESAFNYRTEGFELIDEARRRELNVGDTWCSPFVSPGYTQNEDEHISPAQWLGLLKIYSTMGAEFFYPGNFNLDWSGGVCSELAFPNDFVYTVTTPSYAQGVTSRALNLFRNGQLMLANPMPDHFFEQTINTWKGFNYNFETDKHNSLIVVRKLQTASNTVEYLISGNLNRMSNRDDRDVQEESVKINLEGEDVHFNLRTQGSNYIFKKKINQPNKSTFYQLDGWHQASHPAHWTKSFQLEGELNDNPDGHFEVYTWRPSAYVNTFNFTNFRSFIKLNVTASTKGTSSDPAIYKFYPRALDEVSSYEVRISARKKNAAADLFIEFEGNVIPLGCQISSNNWQDYPAFCNGNPIIITPSSMEKEHEVKVYAANGEVHLDYITIVPVSGSNRTAIQVEEKLDMNIYPNPANSKALLKVEADQPSSAELRILNLNGQTISVRSLELQAGEQEFAIPVSELANGMYMIQLKTENVTLSEKLQILH